MGFDPTYLYDNSDVLWYGTETYYDAVSALMKVTGKSEDAVTYMLNGQYGAADYWTALDALRDQGVIAAKNTNGYNCFAYADKVTETMATGPISGIDSNAMVTTNVKAAPVYDTVIDDVASSATYNKVLVNPVGSLLTPQHGFYGWKFFGFECAQALQCASIGITLGKTIDAALYNANPDFWDANGMSSLNPETWNSITNGDDSFAAGLFNMIFGLDPNTGNAQAFIDENAFAYVAMWLAQQGAFALQSESIQVDDATFETLPNHQYIVQPLHASSSLMYKATYSSSIYYVYNVSCSNGKIALIKYGRSTTTDMGRNFVLIASDTYNTVVNYSTLMPNGTVNYNTANCTYSATHNGKTVYYTYILDGYFTLSENSLPFSYYNNTGQGGRDSMAWILIYGDGTSSGGIDGMGNQSGATLPDTTNWNTPQNTLTDLQNQYPNLWDNAVPNTIVQPDGTTKTITYVPVATPEANGQWDTQPVSSTSTQANPQVQPQPSPTPENNDLLKLILQLLTMPEPNPDTQTQTQPQEQIPPDGMNPTDTGDGSSPVPTPPNGSASALWSVYHPTQVQINSFGAWLWSTNFVDQLLKVFQNPMEAIISLHKVFIDPVDAGTSTIVAGYLDSQVPSAYVTQQYVYKDCGSVDCHEYFGTVFDYVGTNVSLYLPFIGIVPLNVNEVMRSTISVQYGCDLFTGAILVEVKITRDGNDVVLYQYGGDGGVQYPISGSRSGGFLTGLAATIGAAASVATGGAMLPAAAAALGGSVMSAQKQVQHSGGFSGNSGAMGCKVPYLIIERPQTKVASLMPSLDGYPTNHSIKLSECSGQVVVSAVHVEGVSATKGELVEIENLLKAGVLV